MHVTEQDVCLYVCQKHNGHLSLLSYMSDWLYFVVLACLLHLVLYFHRLIKPKPTVYFT